MDKKVVEKSLVDATPYHQSFSHIKEKLDFSCLENESTNRLSERKPLPAFLVALIGFLTFASSVTALSLFIVKYIRERPIARYRAPTLGLLNIDCYKNVSSISDSDDDINIIYTASEYKTFLSDNNINDIDNIPIVLSDSYFDYCCIVVMDFYCSEEELNLDRNYDGLGPRIDSVDIIDNALVANISVPTLGLDETIYKKPFFALFTKEDISECHELKYIVTQRDTGGKGSSHYDRNGTKR